MPMGRLLGCIWTTGATNSTVKHTGDTLDTKRRAFLRARDELIELRRLKVDNDIYRPDDDPLALEETRFVDIIKKRDTGQ